MIAQWILQVLAGTIVGCVIGYFLLRIFTKIRVFLFRKRSNFNDKSEIENFYIKRFYNTFGFYYDDLIKYAPELNEFISTRLHTSANIDIIKMVKMYEIADAITVLEQEQIDIIKFKQTIENIKNQKALENIDG